MAYSFILESIRALLSERPLLIESISYDYKVPEDKEEQIFDLYLWLTLKQLMDHSPTMEKGLLKAGWDENTLADMKAIVDDGFEEIVNFMHKDYLQAGAVAIASEIRHVYDAQRIDSEGVKKALGEEDYKHFVSYWRQLKKYGAIVKDPSISKERDKEWINIGREKMYSAAYKAFLKSGISLENLCDIGEKLFKLDIWPDLFAGENWVKIAREISKQSQAKKTMAKALQLDRVIDLVHNTGLMIDKSASFAKNGSYDWLLKALNFKKEATPWQMAKRGSISHNVLGRLFRLTDLEGTKEHPMKTKEELEEEKKKNKQDTKIQKEEPPASTKKDAPTPDPKTWHRHPNGGGWVENTADVADTAYVGKNAMVYGKAGVYNSARIDGYAKVYGNAKLYDKAKVHEKAMVYGNAKIYEDAWVDGNAEVYDNAELRDNFGVYGNARVYGGAVMYGKARVRGNVRVYGKASIYGNAHAYGNAKIYGSAKLYGNAAVFQNSIVCDHTEVFDDAKVYGNSQVYSYAKVHGAANVYDDALVYDHADISGEVKIHRDAKVGSIVLKDYEDIRSGIHEDPVKQDVKSEEEPPSSTQKDAPTPDPKTWHKHLSGGGWVENTANVADTAYVSSNAMVFGNAHVLNNAEIHGNSMVYDDAFVYGNAILSDSAKVYGNAKVHGKVQVYHRAEVYGKSEVSGYARVYGHALVYDNASISGQVHAYGNAKVHGYADVYENAKVFGNAEVYDYAKVYGDALVYDNANVHGSADVYDKAKVYDDANVSGLTKLHGSAIINGNDVVTIGEYTNDAKSTS